MHPTWAGDLFHNEFSLNSWGFAGGPVVRTSPSNTGHAGSIPGWGARIPHAVRPKNQKHKTETVL